MMKKFPYLVFLLVLTVHSKEIVVDGDLNESEWKNAVVINDYFEVSPYTREPAKEKTVALIFSNKDGIYIGFKNYQENSSMLAQKSMRDETPNTSDQNGVAIDFDGDRSKAYMFQVTLADIKADGIRALGSFPKYDWDGDWEVKTKKYDGYWVSEYYIPWNVVLMKNVDTEKREINITTFRYIARDQTWLNDSKTNGFRSNFLSNMKTIKVDNYTKSKLNFFPYISKTYNSVTDFDEDKIGTEVFYNTGTGKQVNLTINPDFGQAESDEVIINFSAQETFYSEKRAFFNENQSLFNLSHYDRYRIINTRRIGSASSYDCSSSINEEACNTSRKTYTDIDFALRFTQKVNNKDFGIFVAKEADESFTKGRDYIALRSKTKVGTKTFGHFLTHVEDNFLNEGSTVGVFDYSNVKSNKLTLYNDVLASEKDGQTGIGLRSQFVYKPTILSKATGSLLFFEDDFKLNDFGYLKRGDWFHLGVGGDNTLNKFSPESPLNEFEFGMDINYDADTSGNSNPIRISQKNEFTFKDTSKFQFSWDFKTSGKNTTITRKNETYPFVKKTGSVSFNLDYEAPYFKKWTYDWRIGYENGDKYSTWDSEGYERKFAKIAGSFFPTENILIKSQFRIRTEDEWLNWIQGNELAVYSLSQKIISIDMNWFRGNKHEIRLKSQFVALEARNPKSLIVDSLGYLSSGSNDVASFSDGITSFQVRYKYEIAPLSYLYLVYSKGGNVYEDNNERDTKQIFKDPWEDAANEVLSVKIRLKF